MENIDRPVSAESDVLKTERLSQAAKQIYQQLSAGRIDLKEAENRLIEAADASSLPLPEI